MFTLGPDSQLDKNTSCTLQQKPVIGVLPAPALGHVAVADCSLPVWEGSATGSYGWSLEGL